jgi:cyclopropane fatty-acyl-phospholipid synthase-like methyltransferase
VIDRLPENSRILDIGCGTGDDAMWFAERGHEVHACDVSEGMLSIARQKQRAAPADVAARMTVGWFDATRPDSVEGGPWDCLVSNFGALNCVASLEPFFEWAGENVRPGGYLALTVMGRFCLWETIGFALRGQFAKASRRWGGQATFDADGLTQLVHYHSPKALMNMAKAHFEKDSLCGVGVFLPSTEFFAGCDSRPRLSAMLRKLESGCAGIWPFRRSGDHYLLILQKQQVAT